jgi:hypothetical protein
MIDTKRKLPSPSADGWSFDLSPLGGPRFVVLTSREVTARAILAEYLTELGKIADGDAGTAAIAGIESERVSVIW